MKILQKMDYYSNMKEVIKGLNNGCAGIVVEAVYSEKGFRINGMSAEDFIRQLPQSNSILGIKLKIPDTVFKTKGAIPLTEGLILIVQKTNVMLFVQGISNQILNGIKRMFLKKINANELISKFSIAYTNTNGLTFDEIKNGGLISSPAVATPFIITDRESQSLANYANQDVKLYLDWPDSFTMDLDYLLSQVSDSSNIYFIAKDPSKLKNYEPKAEKSR
jgi:hypothetical protein